MIKQEIEVYTENNIYDFDLQIVLTAYPNRIVEILETENKSVTELKCLDLGLGQGYSNAILEKCFKDYTVLDGDSRIIELYKERHPSTKANIIETYFENYETEEKYDVIIMGFILEHVDNPVECLSKYKGLLNKGGVLFAAVPNALSLHRRIGNAMGSLDDMYKLSQTDLEYGHKRYFDRNILEQNCREAGLEIIKSEGLFLKPFTTSQLISLNLSKEILDALCTVGRDFPDIAHSLLVEAR
ncbi:MAG: class I SAM-dependent methyltransferase [Ruminococcus flavefaciens]|nr:class I SAM-dependent methyltransferase [Ruminococcus flavefaciens]